ncbi:hypothetical protein [Tateyamaria sp.]|uniref:hypothetical protein n=1 Tax=Tateyamaria sp. TaxID=1929288 RepID=UPI0032A0CFC8
MFFNPAKTGLIVLGASEFTHEPELNRKVFRNARDAAVSYFRSPNKGLGIHGKNIFDGFDQDVPKSELILKIDQFLSERELADVFIYICSHGASQESILRFFLASSTPDDEDTWVNFERFLDRIEQTALCRIYCVVDCCASGVIHKHSPDISIPPEAAAYVSNAETLALPKRGSVILSANNATNVGTVYAHDSLPGIDLPLFSHCFFDLLNSGNPNRAGFGFSVEQIHDDLTRKIPEAIVNVNEALSAEGAEVISDEHGTMVPEYSDRPVFDSVNGNTISRIGVFPNNDARHELASRVSRSIRINYDRVSRQWDRIQELEAAVEPLEAKIGSLEAQIQAILTDDNVEPRKSLLDQMKLVEGQKNGEIKIVQRARRNARRLAIALILVLSAALAALIFDVNPLLDLRIDRSE